MKKHKFLKVAVASLLSISNIPFSNVVAVELEDVKATAISEVSWTGNIGWGLGTYPQRGLISVTLEYPEAVKADNLEVADFEVQDLLYDGKTEDMGGTVNYNNGYLQIDKVTVEENEVILDITTTSHAGILTSTDGNYRRIVQDFEVTQNDTVYSTDGDVLANPGDTVKFSKDDIYNIASDEFKDLIVDSENSKNKIYVKYYLPENYNESKKYPMVVHHTGGSQHYNVASPDVNIYGEDNYGVELDIDLTPSTFSVNAPEDTIMVTIQCLGNVTKPENYSPGKDINQIVHHFIDNYAVDIDRIYAIGNSQGGLDLSEAIYLEPSLYAAYLPCNTSILMLGNDITEDTAKYKEVAKCCQAYVDEDVAIWFFRGLSDGNYTEVSVPYNILVEKYKEKGYSDTEIAEMVKHTPLKDEEFHAVGSKYYHGATGLMCLNEDAISWLYSNTRDNSSANLTGNYENAIAEIKYDRQEKDGKVTEIPVTDEVKQMIDERVKMGKKYKTAVNATVDPISRTVTFKAPLVDVYLDNSGYKNGTSPAGESFFNLLEFYADVLQVQEIISDSKYERYELLDVNGKKFTVDYINSLVELIDDVYNLDPYTNLKLRQASIEGEDGYKADDLYGGVDVIATSDDGVASFTFHMDHHGFWGYELAGDSFMNKVVDIDVVADDKDTDKTWTLREANTAYANFMKILLPELDGKEGKFNWYLFNNTDLENPYMYVGTNSKGENEALLIDVDFYGEYVINDVIKAALVETYGDDWAKELDTLYIYLTHLHLDHVNNLHIINQDPVLRDKVKILWPEAEEHPTLNGRDLITLFDFEDVDGKTPRTSRVINLEDKEQIEILDHTFELLSVPDQHSNGGSGLVDTTMGVYYSGDTLGSQIHLGGTSVFTTTGTLTQGWLDSMGKTVDILEKYDVNYILTGHTPYPINKDYASWMGQAIDYIAEQLKVNPQFTGLVVVEEGKGVINGTDRFGEIFKTGLTDKEVFDFASVNFMNFSQPTTPENPDAPVTPDTPKDPTKTGDNTNSAVWMAVATLALGGAIVAIKKAKKEDEA